MAIFFIKSLNRIKNDIKKDSTLILVNFVVTSRLEYSNSLLLGATMSSFALFQKDKHAVARLISKADGRVHMTPFIKTLHWLPIANRIEFKALVVCYSCLYKKAPSYLSQLVYIYEPQRLLRFKHNDLLLVVSRQNSKYA